MSEYKFTKGPWQRSGVRVKLGLEDCLQVGPDGEAIAFVPTGRRPKEHAGAIADANLIAAAPELLAALIELLEAADEAWSCDRPCSINAREAIAKATGVEP
jgi:hypothetical protein